LNNGTAIEKKSLLIGNGSSNGIDRVAFNRSAIDEQERTILQGRYHLEGKLVIGFVGRVTRDKGVFELLDAFENLQRKFTGIIKLVMMGHVKCPPSFRARYEANPDVVHIPFQDNVPLYMSLFDVFVLPSWREGFPNVPIQAASMGIPVVVSDATGCVDSVNNGVNGMVFKKQSTESLQQALEAYIADSTLREQHGKNGLKWADNFSQARIWQELEKLYYQ
jgi:glycosyltransferase involved in cell wall biosynthesis